MTRKHNPDRLLSVGIVARELGLTPRIVKAMIAAGRGPTAIRVGAWVRVRRDELDRYKAASAPSGTEAAS